MLNIFPLATDTRNSHYDNAQSTLTATNAKAALDELDAEKTGDAPADGNEYLRKNGAWVPPSAGGIVDAPVDGSLYGRRDGTWVEVAGGSATAAGTTYDNTASSLAATDVNAALDELSARTAAPLVAVIAGADADAAVKAATDYVEGTDDIETMIAQALADGYRSFLLVGTCTAANAVDIDTADAVEIYATPNASLVGDLTISVAGGAVRLLAPVTGTTTDSNGRIERPTLGVGVARIVALTQAEYDALSPDPLTTYFITDAN
jgi:hypothetical protein